MPRPPQRSGPAARHRCRQRRPHPALHPSPPPPAMPLGLQPAQTPVPLPPVIERSCEGKQTQVSQQGPCACVLPLPTGLAASVAQGRASARRGSEQPGRAWVLAAVAPHPLVHVPGERSGQHAACWRQHVKTENPEANVGRRPFAQALFEPAPPSFWPCPGLLSELVLPPALLP